MNVFISLLRGINVSGKKLIKMDALTSLFEGLGYDNVSTYVQSGNVVFCTTQHNIKKIESKIYDKINEIFQFDVPNIILVPDELQQIINDNPFLKNDDVNTEYLYFTFLSSDPKELNVEALSKLKSEDEDFVITNRAIYLYLPNGYSRTKLTNTAIEKALNIITTTRNYNTTTALLKMANLK
jgi:uncharacterized protein (DUF1697 family)